MADADRPYRTRLYRNGASQAVRIPKDLAYPEDIEVELVREGDAVIVRPAEHRLTGLGAALRQMGTAMQSFERDGGEHQERDWSAADADRRD
jgi:antitoxin VapB